MTSSSALKLRQSVHELIEPGVLGQHLGTRAHCSIPKLIRIFTFYHLHWLRQRKSRMGACDESGGIDLSVAVTRNLIGSRQREGMGTGKESGKPFRSVDRPRCLTSPCSQGRIERGLVHPDIGTINNTVYEQIDAKGQCCIAKGKVEYFIPEGWGRGLGKLELPLFF